MGRYALELLDDDAEEVLVELLVPQRELRALLGRTGGGIEAGEQPRELEPAVEGVVCGGHGRWTEVVMAVMAVVLLRDPRAPSRRGEG